MNVTKHLEIMGHRVEDIVTGFKGVVTSVGFDLFGCVQAIVNPGTDKDGKPAESHWFDVNRLRVTTKKPVMERPQFEWGAPVVATGDKGPAEKPRMNKV